MPLYDVKCPSCKHEEERLAKFDETIWCTRCGVQTQRVHKPARYIPFKERVFEHFGPDPILVKSKRQLRGLCKEHGVKSVYLEDG